MKSFNAFFKKELLENIRSGRLIILGIIFIALGIMNPAIAKLTPLLMEIMSEELASTGIVMSEITVDALTLHFSAISEMGFIEACCDI